MLSKKVKLYLNDNQKMIINTLSNEHRLLYNHLLQFTKTNKLDYKTLNDEYKNYRLNNDLTINSKSAQNTCLSLINNIKSYLALKKTDKTFKFPYKFKSYKYFTSFTFDNNNGCGGFKLLNNNQLVINLLSAKIKSKKLIINLNDYCSDINMSNVKTITFSKDEFDNYYLIFVYQENKSFNNLNLNRENYLSIDLGYSTLINGITKNENIKIKNFYQKYLDKRIELIQSKKDKKVKNSNRYKQLNKTYKRLKNKKVNQLKDFQHKVSKRVVDYCILNDIGTIVIGDLKVKSVIKKENRIKGESKLTSVGRFKTLLEYKANNVNIDYKYVNEYNTSKMNCLTGLLEFDSSLSNREFIYNNIKVDRDINSCINILTKSGQWLTQDDKIHLLNNKIISL